MLERTALRPVLMVAEKFPPHATPGATRPFFFARYLCDFGYRPVVLTSPLLRGDRSDPNLLRQLPADVEVVRAFRSAAAARLAFPSLRLGDSATSGAVPDRIAWIGCRPRWHAALPWVAGGQCRWSGSPRRT